MYKVFFNDSFIGFCSEKENKDYFSEIIPFQSYSQIHQWLDDAESNKKCTNTILIHPKPEVLWRNFKLLFRFMEAAGGLVLNDSNQMLFIYKKGKWDLPKGKIDKDEKPCDTAVREVCEETGLSSIQIVRELTDTYHIYKHNNKLILKKTYWFLIKNNGSNDLVSQKEENIEKASWIDLNDISNILNKSYGSINDVFNIYNQSLNQ